MMTLPLKAAILLATVSLIPTVAAQDQSPGQVASSAVGQAGQRQSRGQSVGNVTPAARVSNRISNRVRSRLQLRIDKNYSRPVAASSAYQAAAESFGKVE